MLNFTISRGTEIVFRNEAGRAQLGVSILRTLRLPDDGVRYPLPPGMGPLPLRCVADLAGRVPPSWLAYPGVVVPMYRCEAIWLLFSTGHPLPHAVKIGCGGINALSGQPLSPRLAGPVRPGLWRRMLGATVAQDYAVCPPQQFIDGFNTGHHGVRQFVAVPLGEGKTVEAQLTGREQHGGIQLCVYPPRRELEPALAGAGRLALPGLVPVTSGGEASSADAPAWEWEGPGEPAIEHRTPVLPPSAPPELAAHAQPTIPVEPSAPWQAPPPPWPPPPPPVWDYRGGGEAAPAATVVKPAGVPAEDVFGTTMRGYYAATLHGHGASAGPPPSVDPRLATAAAPTVSPRPIAPAPPMIPTLAQDPFVGKVIDGRYEIQARIGEGGMGVVYKARQISIDRVIALKMLNQQMAGEPTWVQRFYNEAKACSRLQHPNTIRMFDFGQTSDQRLFMTMEFLDGISLRGALQSGPLAPQRVVKILIQCCASLAEAHSIGIVHGNLKPENVFLLNMAGSPDFVKLLDFSVAKQLDGLVAGTPQYMSPEQGRGLPLDARSDLYALGILAFEMLTGMVPFHDENPMTAIQMHLHQPVPPMPENVPYSVQQLVRRALEKEPARRYQSAGEMLQHCQQVFAEVTQGGMSLGAGGVPRTVVAPGGGMFPPQMPPPLGAPPGMGPRPSMAAAPVRMAARPGAAPPDMAARPGAASPVMGAHPMGVPSMAAPSPRAVPASPMHEPQPPLGMVTTVGSSVPVSKTGAYFEVTGSTLVQPVADRPMGLGAGGQISQRIYADPYGIETWNEAACVEVFIHIVSPRTWYAMTGEPPPPTPVTYRAYQAAGLPWFQIYDEDLPSIAPSHELEKIRSIDDLDRR